MQSVSMVSILPGMPDPLLWCRFLLPHIPCCNWLGPQCPSPSVPSIHWTSEKIHQLSYLCVTGTLILLNWLPDMSPWQSCKEDESVLATLEAQNAPIKVEDCLEAFTREEHLHAECSQCKKEQRVSKRLEIWRLPPILVCPLLSLRNIRRQRNIQMRIKCYAIFCVLLWVEGRRHRRKKFDMDLKILET